jgi:hypothetical protein
MVDNDRTNAVPRRRAFAWVLRGIAAECFVLDRFFNIIILLN